MPFSDFSLADTQVESLGLTVGDYIFQVMPGAEYRVGKFSGLEELNVRFVVAQGDSKGKGIFVSYPDPSKLSKNGKSQKVFGQALKKLEVALGVDSFEGEDTRDYLNRVATTSPALFAGKIIEDVYLDKNQKEVHKPKFSIFDVGPAA